MAIKNGSPGPYVGTCHPGQGPGRHPSGVVSDAFAGHPAMDGRASGQASRPEAQSSAWLR